MTALPSMQLRISPFLDEAALDRRVAGLALAMRVAAGRLEPASVDRAERTLNQTAIRREFGSEHTIVALVGPCGAGKSAIFNAILGSQVAHSSPIRRADDEPLAAIWGDDPLVLPMLDWLGVRQWHFASDNLGGAPGLMLIDLPGLDSRFPLGRSQADHVLDRADVIIWVLDPEKYSDALIHADYLERFSAQSAVSIVVLNQMDCLDPDDGRRCLRHLQDLLDDSGRQDAPVVGTSAQTGLGIPELRGLLRNVTMDGRACLARSACDIARAADGLAAAAADFGTSLPVISREAQDQLSATLADGVGLTLLGTAVGNGVRQAGHRATGWPVTLWLSGAGLRHQQTSTSWSPRKTLSASVSSDPVAQARTAVAISAYARAASVGAPKAWVRSTDEVASACVAGATSLLDAAMASGSSLDVRQARWWTIVKYIQIALLAVTTVGFLWLMGLRGYSLTGNPTPGTPHVLGLAAPILLICVGLLAGLVLAILSGVLTARRANRERRAATDAISAQINRVSRSAVAQPIDAELGTLSDFRIGILGSRG